MSLYDFFFPEEAQAEHLGTIARASERGNRFGEGENEQLHARVKRLEYDLGALALVTASILKLLDEKGHVTRDEIKKVIGKIDLLDRAADGKISVDDLRAGDFFGSA
ncbi:MAG: hypothetical protein QOF61_1518 [Acidobacteriota bacterium]|jgi:hypothetical protein|nr:hypothetical protein [Acidobacteriota bacterium]